MKCFYHPVADAVGVCKFCARGLCHKCSAECAGGLACRDKHEQAVDAVSNLVARNIKLARVTPVAAVSALVYWTTALVFAYLAYSESAGTTRILLAAMAAIMVVCAIPSTRLLLTKWRVTP